MKEHCGGGDEVTRTELVDKLAGKLPNVALRLVEGGVKLVFEQMANALQNGRRIEIRDFGSFALRYKPARTARNPKTGKSVLTLGKYGLYFKPGKALRERVNEGRRWVRLQKVRKKW